VRLKYDTTKAIKTPVQVVVRVFSRVVLMKSMGGRKLGTGDRPGCLHLFLFLLEHIVQRSTVDIACWASTA
jgi:hypothetical protein